MDHERVLQKLIAEGKITKEEVQDIAESFIPQTRIDTADLLHMVLCQRSHDGLMPLKASPGAYTDDSTPCFYHDLGVTSDHRDNLPWYLLAALLEEKTGRVYVGEKLPRAIDLIRTDPAQAMCIAFLIMGQNYSTTELEDLFANVLSVAEGAFLPMPSTDEESDQSYELESDPSLPQDIPEIESDEPIADGQDDQTGYDNPGTDHSEDLLYDDLL